MDEAGVNRVLIVPPSWEGDRIDYALEACEAHPDRFGIMARVPQNKPVEGAANDGLMAEVDTIENADGQKERTGNLAKLINRAQHAGNGIDFAMHGSPHAPRMRETVGRLRMRFSIASRSAFTSWPSMTPT